EPLGASLEVAFQQRRINLALRSAGLGMINFLAARRTVHEVIEVLHRVAGIIAGRHGAGPEPLRTSEPAIVLERLAHLIGRQPVAIVDETGQAIAPKQVRNVGAFRREIARRIARADAALADQCLQKRDGWTRYSRRYALIARSRSRSPKARALCSCS